MQRPEPVFLADKTMTDNEPDDCERIEPRDEIAAREDRADRDDDSRPDDCACWSVEAGLPCFVCFCEGHTTQNPAEPAADRDE